MIVKLPEHERRRVYLACAMTEAHVARNYASVLAERGHYIVSRWHDTKADLTAKERELAARQPGDLGRIWVQNMTDMGRASIVVVPTMQGNPRTTLAEIGVALERRLPVAIVATVRELASMPCVCFAPGVTFVDLTKVYFMDDLELVILGSRA